MPISYAQPQPATVRGDWLDEDHPGYPALIAGYWNGWAEPLLEAEQVTRLIADQRKLLDELDESSRAETLRLEWEDDEGSTLLVYCDAEGPEPSRITPNEIDGSDRYSVGLGWTWDYEVTGEDPATPTEEMHESMRHLRDELGDKVGHVLAEPDGSHVVGVLLDLRNPAEYAGREIRRMEQVGAIRIRRDGTMEPAK